MVTSFGGLRGEGRRNLKRWSNGKIYIIFASIFFVIFFVVR